MKTTIQRAIKLLQRSYPDIENGVKDQTLVNDIKAFLDKQPEASDEQYLNDCIKKATPGLSKIKDVDKTLDEIRGGEPKQTARPYYFDCWGRKGAAMTKTIWAITKEDAILLFGAKYPDYNYDPPYTDE